MENGGVEGEVASLFWLGGFMEKVLYKMNSLLCVYLDAGKRQHNEVDSLSWGSTDWRKEEYLIKASFIREWP